MSGTFGENEVGDHHRRLRSVECLVHFVERFLDLERRVGISMSLEVR